MAANIQLQADAQAWIEAILKQRFDANISFADNLKSGVILCELINTINPGTVPKIYEGQMKFKQIENISLFLRGCQAMGMPKSDCFNPSKDLIEEKNIGMVLACIEGLGGLCQAHNIPVPPFGKMKYATANKREWSEEQLKAQKAADRGTIISQGSYGTMERQAVSKGGITFGNEYSGSGSGAQTLVNSGSAGIMERQAVSKGGITFGNEYAGAGSDAISMINQGSTGTMERSAVSKSGITFGNTYSGVGSAGESTLVNQGSTGTMERREVTKGGITFGNEYAGAGSGEATMINQGSTGTMERAAVSKSGITFGFDSAGKGSGEATMINQGSTGTMERSAVTKSGITFGYESAGHGSTGEATLINQGSYSVMEEQRT